MHYLHIFSIRWFQKNVVLFSPTHKQSLIVACVFVVPENDCHKKIEVACQCWSMFVNITNVSHKLNASFSLWYVCRASPPFINYSAFKVQSQGGILKTFRLSKYHRCSLRQMRVCLRDRPFSSASITQPLRALISRLASSFTAFQERPEKSEEPLQFHFSLGVGRSIWNQ